VKHGWQRIADGGATGPGEHRGQKEPKPPHQSNARIVVEGANESTNH
jgi:hypothetical protein